MITIPTITFSVDNETPLQTIVRNDKRLLKRTSVIASSRFSKPLNEQRLTVRYSKIPWQTAVSYRIVVSQLLQTKRNKQMQSCVQVYLYSSTNCISSKPSAIFAV